MSSYGKAPPPQLHGYDPARTYSDNSYPYTAPIYNSQPPVSGSITAPVYHNATQLTAMAYPSSQGRAAFDNDTGTYLNVGATSTPTVTSYSPHKGARETKVYVYISSLYELQTASVPNFFLMFGQVKCQASLQKLQPAGACEYTVSADAPNFQSTNYNTSTVPLCMIMESGDGDVIEKIDVGDFTYLDSGLHSGNTTPQEVSRKRKISSESADFMKSPAKRTSTQQLRPKEEYGAYAGYAQGDSIPTYAPYIQPSNQYGNLVRQYGQASAGYHSQASRHLYGYATSGTSSPSIKAQSTPTGTWNPAYATVGASMSRSPGMSSNAGMTRPFLSSLPSPGLQANPPLIRTSTIQQTPSPATTPHRGHPGHHFNSYTLYPHKAKLEIRGDLEAMASKWSDEEFEARRRLVHFQRSQSGSTITTTFSPVSADRRPQNSVCISCIYWEEKQECFVTSVDTIYLLEQLVAARFTVEEKNRIRRNLEGFRPLTVSKGKTDSEEFFKVIMAFPVPKPRNIEKDVKVFHWKDLGPALKKIIGKYSASPASTLPSGPSLLTPVSSTGYEGSSIGLSYANDHHTLSPRSISGSTTSTTYSNIPARAMSPHTSTPMSLQGGPPDLRVALPHGARDTHWQNGQHHMQTSQNYLANSSNRNSWDNYVDTHPGSAAGTPVPTPNLNYQAARNGADSVGSGDNRNIRSISGNQQPSQQMPRS